MFFRAQGNVCQLKEVFKARLRGTLFACEWNQVRFIARCAWGPLHSTRTLLLSLSLAISRAVALLWHGSTTDTGWILTHR